MFGNILAVYMFHAAMLSPNSNVKGLKKERDLENSGVLRAIVFTFIAMNLASTYVISNLMGRRTGHLLSAILRCLTFLGILSFTLTCMIIIRLLS